MTCKHLHGDFVPALGTWVCGQCFRLLAERPTRYGGPTCCSPKSGPQVIVWQAEILVSAEGTTLAAFLRTMAKRYQHKCRDPLTEEYAHRLALDMVSSLGDAFGDPAWDWSHASARDLADEDMSYWETEGDGANA